MSHPYIFWTVITLASLYALLRVFGHIWGALLMYGLKVNITEQERQFGHVFESAIGCEVVPREKRTIVLPPWKWWEKKLYARYKRKRGIV